MNFNTILGYKVREEKLSQLTNKYRLNTNLGILFSVERFIQRSGFPISRFALIRQEDMEEGDENYFILTLYNGPKKKEEVDVKKILNKFPPRFFELLRRDLDVQGEPQFYLAEP